MKNKKADISLIRKYLNGELDARAMYELERQAQDDPVLKDIIQGVESSSREVDELNLTDIGQMIRQRVEESKSGTTGGQRISWKAWLAAASLILVSAIGVLLWADRPLDQPLMQDQQVVQGQLHPEVNPENGVKTDTVPVINEVSPEIKTGLAGLSRRKINPVAAGKQGNPAENPVTAISKNAPVQVLKDSSVLAAADVVQAQAKNSNDANSLKEVAIVGYGVQRKTMTTASVSTVNGVAGKNAQPVIGWPAYKKYLKENATLGDGKGGKVTLAFSIDAEGRPSQVRIVNGAAATLNQKAIWLIENGSRWIRGQGASTEEVTLKIKFH